MERIPFGFFVSSFYVVLLVCFGFLGISSADPPETPFKCPEQFGYYADNVDCSKYFVCVFGDPLHESCTGGLYFSAELQTCDWPRNVECANGAEPQEKKENAKPSQEDSFASNRKTAGRNQETRSRPRPTGVSLGRVSSNSAVQSRAGSRYKPGSADDFLPREEDTTHDTSRQNQLRSSPSAETTTSTAAPSTTTEIPTPPVPTTELHVFPQTTEDSLTETETTSPVPTKSSLDDTSDNDEELVNNRFPGYDPQQPQFDEAVPPVVDADGNIHIPDGSGGPFSNNPRTSDIALSVFVKPIYGNSKESSNSRSKHGDRSKDIYLPGKINVDNDDTRSAAEPPSTSDSGRRVTASNSNTGKSKEPEDAGIFYRSNDRSNRGRSTATLQLFRNVERYRQPGQDELRRRPNFSLNEQVTNNGDHHDPDAAVPAHGERAIPAGERITNDENFEPVEVRFKSNRQPQDTAQHDHDDHYNDDDYVPEQGTNNGHHKDEDAIPEQNTNNGHHKDEDAVRVQHGNNGHHKDPDVVIIHHTNNGNHKDPDVVPAPHSNNGNHKDPDVNVPEPYDKPGSSEVSEFRSLRTESQPRQRNRNRQITRDKENTRQTDNYSTQLYATNPRTISLAPVQQHHGYRFETDPKFNAQHEFAKIPPQTTTALPQLPPPPKFQLSSRKTYSDYASLPYGYSDYYKEDTDSKQPLLYVARQRPTSRTSRPRSSPTTRRTTTTTSTTIPPSTKRLNRRPLPTGVNRPATRPPSLEVRGPPKPASRPPNVHPTPVPLANAEKCEAKKCHLPDCRCGGTDIPGGLKTHEVPQIVLLTFDDAINDLNFNIYEEIFSPRTNPNGCPILGTFYVSHEWTDYGHVQTLYHKGHEMASHTITHSFGEKFSTQQWLKEVNGQREILHLYGGVKLEDVRGMRAPFLQIGGNKMFEMLHEANFTYDSSMPVFENNPPYWPYTMDYAMNHECMIAPCPTKSFPGVWEIGMVMWVDLRGGRCSMGDACSNPSDEEGVHKVLMKNFNRHYKSNRAPFNLYYHSAWFTTQHHRRGFIKFLDEILSKEDVWLITNWQMIQWIRNPTPNSQINNFEPWQCKPKKDRPPQCRNPQVCNVWYQGGVRFMKTCQPCPSRYPWVGYTGFEKRG